MIFFKLLPIKTDATHETFPYLKMKPTHLKTNPPLKSEAPFKEMIPRKNPEKSETVINTWVSGIKQHWKKMAEITQEHDFLTWGIQTFVRKVKHC